MFRELSADYPDVKTKTLLVDAASMFMIREPERFGVVVCSNLFGDILTDLGAAVAGGMGLAAGANLDPEKRFPSMFEPVHGSAPDIAGKGQANPMATIWAAAQMLDHLGRADWAGKILESLEAVLEEGQCRTPDLGGHSSTEEVTAAIIAHIR
jgi:tartrate dehydrogenase/decarboxylase/D-malate dehydrogenase